MDYYNDKINNITKIVTCSDDKTVIFWNIPNEELISNQISNKKDNHIFYSIYIRHIFYLGDNFDQFKVKEEEIISNTYNLSAIKKIIMAIMKMMIII